MYYFEITVILRIVEQISVRQIPPNIQDIRYTGNSIQGKLVFEQYNWLDLTPDGLFRVMIKFGQLEQSSWIFIYGTRFYF